VTAGAAYALSEGEIALLIDGLTDDVSFSWALIDLGLRGNPPLEDVPPYPEMIAAAFVSFERLLGLGLVAIGRIDEDPNPPPGSYRPVKHVAEPIETVRDRVERDCSRAASWSDWAFCCLLDNTDAGDEVARRHA
jgi:hypothetical protein